MIHDVPLARLGDTVDEVLVVEWFVGPGDRVGAGDQLLLVETDKINVEIVAPIAGVVVECLVGEGDDVPTGAVLCRIEVPE